MRKAIKTTTKVIAYLLGDNSAKEQELIREGKIKKISETDYELFSTESKNGKGEVAIKGDYFKIDSSGNPYPNAKEWFEKNHTFVESNVYNQIVKPIGVWDLTEEIIPEIDFIIKTGKLLINKNDDSKYFTAEIWGAMLSAPKDALILIRSFETNDTGEITDVSFDFITKEEFEKTYMFV